MSTPHISLPTPTPAASEAERPALSDHALERIARSGTPAAGPTTVTNDQTSPIAALPWWAPRGSGIPPETGTARSSQLWSDAPLTTWPSVKTTARETPTSTGVVDRNLFRRTRPWQLRTSIGAVLLAVVLLGGAGAGIAAAVNNRDAGAAVDRDVTNGITDGAAANGDAVGPRGAPLQPRAGGHGVNAGP
jgi:hypothetical protein